MCAFLRLFAIKAFTAKNAKGAKSTVAGKTHRFLVAVLTKSTNPATTPRINPTMYSHVVCSQRSKPAPIAQPITVANGNMTARWA